MGGPEYYRPLTNPEISRRMQVQKGHPKGLVVLFFAEMWERFSFYGMRALLVFYMTRHFLFSDNAAYAVYGSYTALVYATPVIGGLIADRLLGLRKSVVLGGVLMALGHFAMAIETEQVFYFALALLICGNGFFKPNISTTVGRLYDEGDPRRDSGFTIFYMGINLGAAAAPLLCGFIGETYGWKYGFGLAGVGMVFGLIVFLNGQKYLNHVAEPPDPERLRVKVLPGLSREHAVYVGSALAALVFWQLVQSGRLVGTLLTIFGIVVLAALLFYLFKKCEGVERDRLGVAMVLISFSMVFWAFFEQAGSSINLFTDRNVERTLFGMKIPASVFQSLNALFILMFGPLFGALWVKLARVGKEPSTPLKFGLGILQLGLGFGALYLGARSAAADGMVWIGWLVLGYMLHTTGELCLSPIGLSMITKLSPVRIGSMMMGTWFLASAFAQYIAGLIAMLTGVSGEDESGARIPAPQDTVMIYGDVFGTIAMVAVAVGVLVVAVSPVLAKRMRGIH
ncbi:MAG TPA: peptide MFS transporter [Polyangiaceae bacterium]